MLLTISCLMLVWAGSASAQERVVLVASVDSPIESLTSFDVRKIYLGVDVRRNGRAIQPLLNMSSERVNEIFLQSVVALTASRYETRLLSNLLRFGTVRPAAVTNRDVLLEMLRANPLAVSYVLLEDGEEIPDLKVLRVLWQGY